MPDGPPEVVHVAPYYPPHLGGMENVARNIAERTRDAGVNVSVFTSEIGGRRSGLPAGAVPVVRCAAFELGHTPVMPGLLRRLLKVPQDAIIHLHVAQPFAPEMVFLAARIRGVPYVAHIHLDVGPSGPLGGLLPIYKRGFLAPALRSAARVVVYTPDYARLIGGKYDIPEGKIDVIPGGIDMPPLPDDYLARTGETVLFVGRLSPQKDIPLLLGAIRILKDRGRRTQLRVVGEGEEDDRIREDVKRLDLEDRVVLLGRLEGKELADEYRRASILALSSERESFGLVLVEAMSHGTPVVATDIPGSRNVVDPGRTGLLAAADPKSFADAMEIVLADRGFRETLARNGIEAARAYDWRNIIPRYLSLYARIRRDAIG